MQSNSIWISRIAEVKAAGHIPVIAEIKPSSPAEGNLLGNRDPGSLVKAYAKGGAACISVVTGRWFGGDIHLLENVAQHTSLPILRKDLIVNQEQIRQSKDFGATAVLLTRKILQPSHLLKMIEACISLDITPFIEVATQAELDTLPSDERIIVGIANRDIALKEMDIDSGLQSLSLINKLSAKAGAVISASGISSPAEANRLIQAGFDGLLIGTVLLQADNPEATLRELTRRALNAALSA
ncbi:MAG TPA: indole-3-glycerol-phosphate synthase [Cellvibrio sp.]|nr:indole-3-glycerol-phosphate synthase [Cellvibrio sp.]